MLKKIIVSMLMALTFNVYSQTNNVQIMWDVHCNTNVNTYIVYYGTNSLNTYMTNIYPALLDDCGINRPAETNVYKGSYTSTATAIGRTNNSVTLTNLIRGVKYYFAVTCRNIQGLESDRSSEVEFVVPLYSTNTVPSKTVGVRILSIQ